MKPALYFFVMFALVTSFVCNALHAYYACLAAIYKQPIVIDFWSIGEAPYEAVWFSISAVVMLLLCFYAASVYLPKRWR